MSIWKEESKFDYKLYQEIDSFFENLRGKKNVEYREGQATMALDVLDALKNREILLIEAGVGIGKSWGYLIPLLYASKNKDNFKGFIISTSSIALQEQLKEEINKLSKMLDIDIPFIIAKGRNNYICKKRLDEQLKRDKDNGDLQEIKRNVVKGFIDKDDYSDIPNKIWNNINVNYVNCTNCLYKNDCKYMLKRKAFPKAKYVICNHDLLVEALKRDNNDLILQEPSILIVDEAHNLETKIRNSYKESMNKNKIESLILKINFMIYDDDSDVLADNYLIQSLNKVFRMISTKAKYKYRKNAKRYVEMFDEETSGFDISNKLKEEIIILIKQLEYLISEANRYKYFDKKLINYVSILKSYIDIFKDMISDNSKNIYFVSFIASTKEHINLEYVQKDIYKEAAKLLSNNNYGKVFTSATMTTTKDNYNYFANNLGLNDINGISVVKEFSQPSPYDYENNSLLYFSDDCVNPKSLDHDLYLNSIANKVSELIKITDGRTLVLFTSKADMKRVYEIVTREQYDFNIMLQDDDVNTDILKNTFKEDVTSVLFATGTFFEGINVKGEPLENVIITKLPFPVVNPIIEDKASHFIDGLKEVYLPEMLIKLKQGAGRLIRCSTDKGIVSILDSRYKDYEDTIVEALPFTNITKNIEDVESFANNKLSVSKVKK